MGRIRLAMIGLGKIARDQHVPALAGDERFALVATVDPREGLGDVPHFKDFDALVASGVAVDAVTLCTPPQARATLAAAAIAQGWHVFLEKPPAATLAGLAVLDAAAEAAGVTLFAAWHSREAPMVAAAREWLATRPLASAEIVWREDVRRWHPGQAWLWAPGGLGVFDPGINAFSILTDILPAPILVTQARLALPENAHAPIAAQLTLQSGGARLSVDLDFLQQGPQSWDMRFTTTGGETLTLGAGGGTLRRGDGPEERAPEREYARLYDRFATLIAAGARDADGAPLRIVADALLIAEQVRVEPFLP
ncbi:Gfo/Idh/MocA family protein [Sphingomonas morindae]|uniref:Gfo/Idh/MocA family oxidoreductase n=1 Tax=Sphingomonas morindae TaxID=1541170 RepID=A0ABY4XB09_9SPHN|nr:Gfo/Idh/MocA family oxidoreductase [Sphingomonas morindae]USI74043.1 Gfo/Idh/MocA family oxidoreductase [Sphingomonas morindae]